MTVEKTKIPVIKDGVQGIILVNKNDNIFEQKIILVRDFNDRGRGDGRLLLGLPGGGIERGEEISYSSLREIFEEASVSQKEMIYFEKFGCYEKLRPNGVTNNNHLFVALLNSFNDRKTNDPKEVSEIVILSLGEVFEKARDGWVHEGTIRLIIHFLNGKKSGSLNEPVGYEHYIF